MLLIIVMIAGSLAGCKNKTGITKDASVSDSSKDASVKDSSSATDNTAAPSKEKKGDLSFNEEGLPIVKEPVTLTVLTTRWSNMGDSFAKKNQWIIDLEKNTNVKIDWQVQSLSTWNDQKAIMLASGQLPDIIIGSQTFNDQDIMSNQSMFMALDDLVDKYMPNYKAALSEMPELKKAVTFPDGKMYSFGKNLPCRPMTCGQPIINKKWLDNLGLSVPTTTDELYTVLKAFKEKDANGNGDPDDEIPITGSGSKDISMDFLNPFGITDLNGKHMMVEKDGSLVYFPTSNQYKEGIKWLNKLYAEGIIDQEAFTQDDTMGQAKKQDPDVSKVGFDYAWTPDSPFGKWSSEYIAIAPMKGPDGKQYAAGDTNGISSILRNEAEITTFCKNPEIAARWLDQFYNGEASIQNFWGAIGTVITKNADGTYTLNNPPEGTSADAWYWDESLRDFGPKYISKDFESKIKLSPTSGDGLKVELSKLGNPYITTPYPNVMFTTEENQEIPTLLTDIDEYIKTCRANWISKGKIDEEWDAYVKKLNDMGLEKLIKIYTDAYQRYQQ
jgi:putative aldouronate transport system substrate-binding protein